ncbi:MAG: PilT/PilU family type 4a pilus ATPase [Patescibacteria group bacterium]
MQASEKIFIDKILAIGAEYRASDFHLSVGNPPILRVDGKLIPLVSEPLLTVDFMKNFVSSILDKDQQAILEKEKEIVFAYTMENKARFKIGIFYQKGNLAASLRLIANQIKSLKELGLPAIVEKFAELEKGLVILSGPFGSGRTATLGALLNTINRNRAEHIITIEKPIEYVYLNNKSIIEQREVGKDTMSFEQALVTAAHEDFDVIYVSEVESLPVAENVLNAAESSRLVLTTMNTDSVLRTLEKIISFFPDQRQAEARDQLASVIEGVVSQRLLPRVGGGRIAVAEVLIPNDAVRSVIREGAIYQINNILQTSREEGMISLDRSLAELLRTGEILADDALANAVDKQSLRLMMRR